MGGETASVSGAKVFCGAFFQKSDRLPLLIAL
jgi:hypothetical protein